MTMAAAAPNPNNNLILLAVIGIGAYWMLSRRAVAQPVYGAQRPGNGSANARLLNTGLNAMGRLFSGFGGGGSASASNDGVVVNSPFVPAYEWAPGEDYWM